LVGAASIDNGVLIAGGEERLSGEAGRCSRFARIGALSGGALAPAVPTAELLLPAMWPATPEKSSSHHTPVGSAGLRPDTSGLSSGQVSISQGQGQGQGLWPASLVRRSSSVVVVSPTHTHIHGSLHPGAHLLSASPLASSGRLNSACSLSRGDLLPAVDIPSPVPLHPAQSTTPEPQEVSAAPRVPVGGRFRRLLARMAAM
jgi:hypothetical protein